MRMSSHLTAALAAILLVWLAPSGEGSAQSVTNGGTLYTSYCRSCHGGLPGNPSVLNGASQTNLVNTISTNQNMRPLYPIIQAIPNGWSDLAAYIASYLAPPPTPSPAPTPVPPPPTTQVVEYYHAAFGHYFITSFAADMSALDSGRFAGWARTNRSFNAYTTSNGYVSPVCRFFTEAFPPKSSHFFTSLAAECNDIHSNNRNWMFEGEAFYVQQADAATGGCPTGFRAVYRLYNNGQGAAPNHRYTTDPAVRAEIVGFCAPN
jgi:mono/diheme cytochrome c family protein